VSRPVPAGPPMQRPTGNPNPKPKWGIAFCIAV
jgi:hypothetical protein